MSCCTDKVSSTKRKISRINKKRFSHIFNVVKWGLVQNVYFCFSLNIRFAQITCVNHASSKWMKWKCIWIFGLTHANVARNVELKPCFAWSNWRKLQKLSMIENALFHFFHKVSRLMIKPHRTRCLHALDTF